MLFYLVIATIALLIVSWMLHKDISFPSNILIGSFLFTLILAIHLTKKIGSTLLPQTAMLIFIFLLMFLVGTTLGDRLTSLRFRQESNHFDFTIINISFYKVILVVIVQLIILIGLYLNMKKILGTINSTTLNTYRILTTYSDGIHTMQSISGWVAQGIKFSKIAALVAAFVLVNNIFVKSEKAPRKTTIALIISVVLFLPVSLLTASRFDLIILFIFIICLFLTFNSIGENVVSIKNLIIVLFIIIFIIFIFMETRSLIGRATKIGGLNSFEVYVAGGIPLLNDYLINPVAKVNVGEETFQGIYRLLSNLNIVTNYKSVFFEFRSINGYDIGNVYTSIRTYYHDFGIVGVFIFPFISGAFFGSAYTNVHHVSIRGISVKLIIYVYLLYTLFLAPYQELFFSKTLSTEFVTYILLLVIFKVFYGKGKEKNEKTSKAN